MRAESWWTGVLKTNEIELQTRVTQFWRLDPEVMACDHENDYD